MYEEQFHESLLFYCFGGTVLGLSALLNELKNPPVVVDKPMHVVDMLFIK